MTNPSSSSLLSSLLLREEHRRSTTHSALYRPNFRSNSSIQTRRSKLVDHSTRSTAVKERPKGSKGIRRKETDPSTRGLKLRRHDHPGHSAGNKPSNKLYTITNATLANSWSFLHSRNLSSKRNSRRTMLDAPQKSPLSPFFSHSIIPPIFSFSSASIRPGILTVTDDESRDKNSTTKFRGQRGTRKSGGGKTWKEEEEEEEANNLSLGG